MIAVDLSKKKQIVFSKNAPFLLISAAHRLSEYLGIPYVTDEAPEQAEEVLLGQTNRPQTILVRPDTCRVFCQGEKAVFAAVHYQPLCERIDLLIASGKTTVDSENTRDHCTDVPLTWGEYKLVWNDEFEGTVLDLDRWIGNPNMSMKDVVLTMKPGTVDVKDSKLVLTSTILDRQDPVARYVSNYSITTSTTMNFKYGYAEIRAKVPHHGLGEWPSYWFLSGQSHLAKECFRAQYGDTQENPYVATPYETEVDMFEVFSNRSLTESALHKWGPNRYHESIGFAEPRPETGAGGRNYSFTADEDANDWHTYGLLWTDQKLSFFIDGSVYAYYDLSVDYGKEKTGMQGFIDQPLTVLFNNMLFTEGYAENSEWGKRFCLKGEELFPLVYEIDYCRLYQLEDEKSMLFTPKEAGKGKWLLMADRKDHGTHYSDGQEPKAQA